MAAFNRAIKRKGILCGLGIGPGDPELLTVKARKILKKVDIIFVPRASCASESLAFDIIRGYVGSRKVRKIVFPMTKDKKKLHQRWSANANRVYKELLQGNNVAFVTIGDPFLYSTYSYLLRHIRMIDDSIAVNTVPGISVVNAIASVCNVPLAEEDERCVIMPLPRQIGRLRKLLSEFDTVVLLKIGKRLKPLVRFLEKTGYAKKACFAKRIGSLEQQVVKDLSQLRMSEETAGYMSTMIIRPKQKDIS
jgi:precorrin-2/cobalt-factor-2 C20-methyltransferase